VTPLRDETCQYAWLSLIFRHRGRGVSVILLSWHAKLRPINVFIHTTVVLLSFQTRLESMTRHIPNICAVPIFKAIIVLKFCSEAMNIFISGTAMQVL
jgi:hypothetical protein